jgi:hypothetical protein
MAKTEPRFPSSRITGSALNAFERSCYSVCAHGDGTGTIALDWYETSDGHDFCNSQYFMRAEIETARAVVELLNRQLPGRVMSAPTEIDWSGQDED